MTSDPLRPFPCLGMDCAFLDFHQTLLASVAESVMVPKPVTSDTASSGSVAVDKLPMETDN